jgi:hypothetical protein
MLDPYADDPQFIRVEPGYLRQGQQYNLAINVIPDAPYDQTENPYTEENKIFIRHSEERGRNLAFGTIIHTLIFEGIDRVINHSRNRIYRRKLYSEYTLGDYTKPGDDGWRAINKGLGPGHHYLKKAMNQLGGKRKNTRKPKKKTRKPKKKTQKKKTQKNRKK